MNLLIIGKNGQLGRDCIQVLQETHRITGLSSKELDITDRMAVENAIKYHRPDIILNCAAFTKVDACEDQRELAYMVNVKGPLYLALGAAKSDSKLVHISTDYVFNGQKPLFEPYVEDDEPDPLSYYGKTKLEGELAIRHETARYAIIRTAWMYGLHGHNFLKTMLKMAVKKTPTTIRVVNDQFGSLTWSYRLAQQIGKIIEADGIGIYHATAEGFASWFEVADYFLKGMGFDSPVVPCTTADYPLPAPRPKNSILENHRLKLTGINLMRSWQTDLDKFIKLYRDQLLKEVSES